MPHRYYYYYYYYFIIITITIIIIVIIETLSFCPAHFFPRMSAPN